MTLQEAIEILNNIAVEEQSFENTNEAKAVKLGIEALKFRLRWEQQEGEDDFPLLQGETPAKPLYALGFNTGDDESP